MSKLASEGYPYIAFFGAVTLLAFIGGVGWLGVLALVLTFFMAFFFRDPERTAPKGDDVFVSPADGKVILIDSVYENRFIKDTVIELSIFMSPLDVHVNRAPCDGMVESVVCTPGRFLSAFKPEASLQNENIAMVLATKHDKILVRQVAGFLARRAICRVKQGESLRKGDRYGIIKFSSRVDIYLPKDTQVAVKLGERVRAGETIIGYRTGTDAL